MTTILPKILFLTNSEYGQANVHLAVAQELLSRSNISVHISSFMPLHSRVEELRSGGFGSYPETSTLTWHLLSGMSMHEARLVRFGITSIDHKPGARYAPAVYETLAKLAGSRTGKEYVQGVREVKAVIEAVEPDCIAIEEFFFQGMDACIVLNREYCVLAPGTFREHASNLESFWVKITKYPASVAVPYTVSLRKPANAESRKGSGYQFPLPRRRKPANLYLNFRLISKFLTSSHFKPLIEARKKEGVTHKFPGYRSYREDITYILPTTSESDFPCPVPSNIVCCGPIILPSAPLSTVDTDLEAWLRARPTVLLNLGSFLRASFKHAEELALGIKIFLAKNSTHQVLWKLKTEDESYESILQAATQILSDHIMTTRVRVVKWLKAAPSEIVRSGYVVCSVHHGGSSSFFEALSAGVPQIVLPCWWDTYEFATRVEYLGIGIYASRQSKSAPEADGIELGEALVSINDDENESSVLVRERARKLAKVCNAYGGRVKAADKILEFATLKKNGAAEKI